MVRTAVYPIHDQVSAVGDRISNALCRQAAGNGPRSTCTAEGGQFPALGTERALHAADDVAPLAHRPKQRFEVGRELPAVRGKTFRETQLLEPLQAPDQERPVVSILDGGRKPSQVQSSVLRAPLKGMIETRPALLHHLTGQALLDLTLRPRPQPTRGEFRGAMAHSVSDVVARDDQVLAGLIPAPQQDMDMRIVGIPMIGRHPFEPGSEIALDLRHEFPCVGLQVADLGAVFRRDDNLEVMSITLDPVREGFGVNLFPIPRIEMTGTAIGLDTVPLDVVEILPERGRLDSRMLDDAELDDGPPRAWPKRLAGEACGCIPSTEARTRSVARDAIAKRLPRSRRGPNDPADESLTRDLSPIPRRSEARPEPSVSFSAHDRRQGYPSAPESTQHPTAP